MPDLPPAPWESSAPAAPPPEPPIVPSAPWESSQDAGPEPYEKFQKSPLVPGRLQSAEPERPIGDTALARAAGAVPRLADFPEVAAQRNRQAREEMSQGLQRFKEGKSGVETARGIGEMALGGLNYLYSPINAAFDVGVGQPVARAAGSPTAGQYASFGAQVIANPATVAAGLKHIAPETADKLARIFAPETRGPLAQQAAAIIREEGGLAAREQAAAFQELGEAREAQNIMQAGAMAADHVAEDGTRYTALAREFTDYLDGKGAAPSNAKVAAAADAVKPWYQKVRSRIEGLPEGDKYRFLEQYFPIQISQKDKLRSPRGTPEAGGAAASSAGTGFLKGRRMYGSTSEVVDAGEHTLKTADPIKATYAYIMNAERFLATESVWQKARADGIVQYFMFGKQVPEGLAKIENGSHAQIHMPVGGAPWEGEAATAGVMPMQAYAPEQWAKVWNRWQSQVPSDASLLTSVRKFNSAATAYELGLNGYHATVMSMEAVVSDVARAAHKAATPGMRLGALPTVVSALAAPAKYAFRGGQGAREYVGRGAAPSKAMVAAGLRYGGDEAKQLTDLLSRAGARMATSGGQRSLDIAIPGGGPLFRARWKDITGAFERASRIAKGDKDALASVKGGIQRFGRAELADIKEHPVQTALGRPVFRAAFRILDTVAAPLFDEYIPRLKNGAMMSQLSDWMHANPDATMGQKLLAARKISDSIDNRFGEMVHDNVFWTKTAKELAMAGMLSYSWNLGTLREVGGGLLEAPRAVAGMGKTLNLAGNTADLSFKGAYAIALPMVWGLYSAAYQYVKTGKAPEGLADLVNPQTGGIDPKSGKPERLATFGYMKDIAETYQKLVMEKAPLQLLWNKLNPGLLMFLEGGSVGMGMGGSNWRNDPITHPNLRDPLMVSMIAQAVEVAKDFAEEHAPISYKNIVERPKGTHIGIEERVFGMREASSFRVDPEVALLKKQKVIDSRSKAKESHIRKQKSLQEEGIGRHEW